MADKIELSHPQKILYPTLKKTKADVAQYYKDISVYLLPYLKDRPITLRRYPEGIEGPGFYNKHIPDYFPDFIKRIKVPMRTEAKEMLMASANQQDDLIYFANQDVIELHISLSKVGNLEFPDQMIFDFDPSEGFEEVRHAALTLKSILDDKNFPSFVKTSGSKGLHVHVPLKPENPFKDVKEVARKLAEKLVETIPDITTLEQRKEKREGKVFVDILRNDYGMTVIAPYSLRAKEKAPIATPLDWQEVQDPSLNAQSYTINNIFKRLNKIKDPWADFYKKTIKISKK